MAQNLIVFISDRFNIILGVRMFMMAGVPQYINADPFDEYFQSSPREHNLCQECVPSSLNDGGRDFYSSVNNLWELYFE